MSDSNANPDPRPQREGRIVRAEALLRAGVGVRVQKNNLEGARTGWERVKGSKA